METWLVAVTLLLVFFGTDSTGVMTFSVMNCFCLYSSGPTLLLVFFRKLRNVSCNELFLV
jgi:hypothetical protein